MSDRPPAQPDDRECVSELELDRLLAGDDAPALRRRVDACEHCRRRLAELTAARDAHMMPAHVAGQAAGIVAGLAAERPRVVQRRGWRRWAIAAPLPVLAMAALFALVCTRRDGPGSDVIRIKGGTGLEVVLAEPGPQRVLADGEAVPAGATLSFRAACPKGCTVSLFAVGAGGVTPLADVAPPQWRIAGPAPELLPVSATIDDGPGDDLVVAFFCAGSPEIAELRAALDAIYGAAPGADLRAAKLPTWPGCETHAHLLRGRRASR